MFHDATVLNRFLKFRSLFLFVVKFNLHAQNICAVVNVWVNDLDMFYLKQFGLKPDIFFQSQ